MRQRVAMLLLVTVLLAAGAVAAQAPAAPGILKIALLPQWTITQHESGGAGKSEASFRAALDAGVVDRPVFAWQRGLIARSMLVRKEIRVLPPGEAAPLGGRGEFRLVEVRPPAGASAWSEVALAPVTGRADDVAVLEIGGELNTVSQVLESLFVLAPGGGLQAVPPVRAALTPGHGLPVVLAQFARPLTSGAELFRDVSGVQLLAARSLVHVVRNGDLTPAGPADTVVSDVEDWRESDRLFVRVPIGQLASGMPSLVAGWKDRTRRAQPDGRGDRPDPMSDVRH